MSSTETVSCPSCGNTRHADTEETSYECKKCGSEWKWASCDACDRVDLVAAGQESWLCRGCGRYTRSWWRTDSAEQDAHQIRRRRQGDRTARASARLAMPRRQRRRMLIGAAGVAGAALAILALAATFAGDSQGGNTRVACDRFDEVRSDITNGALDAAALSKELSVIRSGAENADPSVAAAARRLVPPATPNSASFLVAQREMAQACGTASG